MLKTTAKRNPTIEIRIKRLSFDFGGTRLWWPNKPETAAYNNKTASSLDVSESFDSDDLWFAFCMQDCFDPIVHIIRARSFETAYEVFAEGEADRGHYVVEHDDPDYATDDARDRLHYTDSGKMVDLECAYGWTLDAPTVETE